ncbi:MAG: YCF48-related protein [Burkholderiales bacterium]|nr:YCF48-related protein [Burkholderiales bacterium]
MPLATPRLFVARLLTLAVAASLLTACATAPVAKAEPPAPRVTLTPDAKWQKLDTVAYRGKQDDIVFINPDLGWYVNGAGKIHKTTDGGKTWVEKLSKPGTFFRTIGFVDEKLGFAGNIGTDYFPGVTDTTPLYQTLDGGETWTVVGGIDGPVVKGLCAIDVIHTQFINSGVMDKRTVIHAGGRVGGPAFLMRSLDGGKTWKSQDLSAHTKMILDVKFFNENEGFVMGASDADTAKSNAIIIATKDGGATWKRVYQSTRPFELTWKASFPTRKTGYVTIQNYNPDKTASQRFVAKTTDGGETWKEVPLVNEHSVRQFGVGFADELTGWVGTTNGGYETRDGGASWTYVDMGHAVNKVRIVPAAGSKMGFVAYAIGVDVRKFAAP